jgi:DNA-binding NtrC family response regulator
VSTQPTAGFGRAYGPSGMPPAVLVIDDFFGRTVLGGRNVERDNLCAQYLIEDITGDDRQSRSSQTVVRPVARGYFMRGQQPAAASVGDTVENDLEAAVAAAASGQRCLEARSGGRALPWALVLVDLCFYTGRVTTKSHALSAGTPEGRDGDAVPSNYFGLRVLEALQSRHPKVPVVVFSSKPREDANLQLSEAGALGFIARDDPMGPEALRSALWQHGLMPDTSGLLAGSGLAHLEVLRAARRASLHKNNVLLLGERGTGKDLLARFVNASAMQLTPSSPRPFVAVNSAVFSQDLAGAELFGIEARSATGVDGKIGYIEQADGGDLFLDEVADMGGSVQAALLRVIQDKQVTRIGARQSRAVDVRFISATNGDLLSPGIGFRSDLLDRLGHGGVIRLAPLRERADDLPELATRFVSDCETALGLPRRRAIRDETLAVLRSHSWPGNVRELQSVLFAAVANYPDMDFLVPSHLHLADNQIAAATVPPTANANTGIAVITAPPAINASKTPDVVALLESIQFDASSVTRWAGAAPSISQAVARLWARYLKAAITATRRVTPEAPHGLVQIHPAVKLMKGRSDLTAMQAADEIKRMLTPIANELDGELATALETALRLRPRDGRKSHPLQA